MQITFKPLKSFGDSSAKVIIIRDELSPNREVLTSDERLKNTMSGHQSKQLC